MKCRYIRKARVGRIGEQKETHGAKMYLYSENSSRFLL